MHNLPQDLAAQLQSDCRRGLPAEDEEDRAMRVEAFGANRLAERKEVSFKELVLEALEVRLAGLAKPRMLHVACWPTGFIAADAAGLFHVQLHLLPDLCPLMLRRMSRSLCCSPRGLSPPCSALRWRDRVATRGLR